MIESERFKHGGEPIMHKSKNFQEPANIKQHIRMSSSDRQAKAKKLRDDISEKTFLM
jgi:hypothetical protein